MVVFQHRNVNHGPRISDNRQGRSQSVPLATLEMRGRTRWPMANAAARAELKGAVNRARKTGAGHQSQPEEAGLWRIKRISNPAASNPPQMSTSPWADENVSRRYKTSQFSCSVQSLLCEFPNNCLHAGSRSTLWQRRFPGRSCPHA